MIKLTKSAAAQIRVAVENEGGTSLALRFAVAPKPDGSFEYRMGFDEPVESDIRVVSDGVDIVYAADQEPLLDGMTVDYVELEPGQFHFIFLNPNDPNYVPPQESTTGHDLGG